jgi:hypothetical protein
VRDVVQTVVACEATQRVLRCACAWREDVLHRVSAESDSNDRTMLWGCCLRICAKRKSIKIQKSPQRTAHSAQRTQRTAHTAHTAHSAQNLESKSLIEGIQQLPNFIGGRTIGMPHQPHDKDFGIIQQRLPNLDDIFTLVIEAALLFDNRTLADQARKRDTSRFHQFSRNRLDGEIVDPLLELQRLHRLVIRVFLEFSASFRRVCFAAFRAVSTRFQHLQTEIRMREAQRLAILRIPVRSNVQFSHDRVKRLRSIIVLPDLEFSLFRVNLRQRQPKQTCGDDCAWGCLVIVENYLDCTVHALLTVEVRSATRCEDVAERFDRIQDLNHRVLKSR